MLTWQDSTGEPGRVCLVNDENKEREEYGHVQAQSDGPFEWCTLLSNGTADTLSEAKEMVERKMMCYPLNDGEPCIGRYNDEPYKFGDRFTVRRFRAYVKDGSLTDNDGHGHPIRHTKMDAEYTIWPSKMNRIPEDATHIQWYNK